MAARGISAVGQLVEIPEMDVLRWRTGFFDSL
jgi:hypothetical protein